MIDVSHQLLIFCFVYYRDDLIAFLHIKRRVCVITQKEEELRKFIIEDLHSGATIYEATGAYNRSHTKCQIKS